MYNLDKTQLEWLVQFLTVLETVFPLNEEIKEILKVSISLNPCLTNAYVLLQITQSFEN